MLRPIWHALSYAWTRCMYNCQVKTKGLGEVMNARKLMYRYWIWPKVALIIRSHGNCQPMSPE